MFDLPLIWGVLIAVAVLAYVMLDGFDLGIGLLFPFLKKERDRDTAMNSVAPVWDGNETWLVLGGGGLYAVFPLAYAIILPALYAPITAMLLGLVFRGVAFEYRWRTTRGKRFWDFAFFGGSLVAALSQGITLGALLQGIPVVDRAYAGGWWDWLTPFSLYCGAALVCGYVLLGSTWLVMKTEGGLYEFNCRVAQWSFFAILWFIAGATLWTPIINIEFYERWMSWPALLYTIPVPLLVLVMCAVIMTGLSRGKDAWPFLGSLGLFVLCFAGLGLSVYPNIVPPSITIWDAAGPDESLGFLLVGAGVLLPIIGAYTAYAYWVFRGKVDPSEGYHE